MAVLKEIVAQKARTCQVEDIEIQGYRMKCGENICRNRKNVKIGNLRDCA